MIKRVNIVLPANMTTKARDAYLRSKKLSQRGLLSAEGYDRVSNITSDQEQEQISDYELYVSSKGAQR